MKLYQPSPRSSFRQNYIRTLVQTSVFWGFFLVLMPWTIVRVESWQDLPTSFSPLPWPAGVLFAVASILGLRSGYVMSRRGEGTPLPTECPRKLVIEGPYAYVRNPMAIAGIVQGVAVGIFLGSSMVIAYSLMGVPAWHLLARPSEESDMRTRFGGEFTHYQQHVRLWIPRWTRYQPPRSERPKDDSAEIV